MQRKEEFDLHPGTTATKRGAIITRPTSAVSRIAPGHTSVGSVEGPNHCPGASAATEQMAAQASRIQSPFLKFIGTWKKLLSKHPDTQFTTDILHGIQHGVNIGYRGPRKPHVHKNWESAHRYKHAVLDSIHNDLQKGRLLGPFLEPPLANFVGSPMGAFPKKRSPGHRVIHDFSWPPGESVNDYISREEFTLRYVTMDQIVDCLQKCGENCKIAKIDLCDAYKHILVRREDWELLGLSVTQYNSGVRRTEHYIPTVLQFGLRSAPFLFNKYADALEYCMLKNGVTHVQHYVDDYITYDSDAQVCANNVQIMLDTCSSLGFTVQQSKVTLPSTCTEVLGIVIDTKQRQLRISSERLQEVMAELNKWRFKRSATKRRLLSLIGKLTFVARVVRAGRIFTRRLIELSKKPKFLHHRVRLNKDARADIKWWQQYLPLWNGVSYFYDEHWINSHQLNLWTDASDWGIGSMLGTQWFSIKLNSVKWKNRPIAWRELYAVVTAAATWCEQLRGKRILYYCDNMAVVAIINSGVSKCSAMMILVRELFYISAQHGFEWTSEFLGTAENSCADALSRGEVCRFRELVPNANKAMAALVLPASII